MNTTVSYTQRFFLLMNLLRTHSDAAHRLRSTELAELLATECGMPVDRRSVQKALEEMQQSGMPVIFDHGWYYAHEFTPEELIYLADCIRFNNCLPEKQQAALLRKLSVLGGAWQPESPDYSALRISNEHFMEHLARLHDAIREAVQVEIVYGDYDVDLALHPRLNRAGNPKVYELNPYEIATVNGRFYLIANVKKHTGLCHFRVDRILELKKKKQERRPIEQAAGTEIAAGLPEYVAQHGYMYSGPAKRYRLRVKRSGINDVLDWFGTAVTFEHTTDAETDVIVLSDEASLDFWVRRYRRSVRKVSTED